MSAAEVTPEQIASSSHPIDGYYDKIFADAPQGEDIPYDENSGLYVWLDQDKVKLTDPNEHAFRFTASRDFMEGQEVVTLSICNDIKGARHPLLYPGRLLQRAIPLLERTGNVDAIMGYWLAPPVRSDNYRDYVEGLDRLAPGRIATEADCAKAAQDTWTGQQLGRLGYTAVQSIQTTDIGSIKAFFTRPS